MFKKLIHMTAVAILAATLVQAASAGVRQTSATRADGLRWQAEARWYANRPAASYYTSVALHAMGARMQAQAHYYAALPGPSSNRSRTIAIAAGAAAALLGVVASFLTLLARSRRASTVVAVGSES